MKKKWLVFFTALLMVNVVCHAQQFTVAVSQFEARAGQTKDDAEGITELFIAELVANGNVRVVDRTSFDKIMAEMKFQDTDWADSNRVAQLGKALNANSIIRGKLMSLAGQTVISASILDINTAQILSSSTIQMANIDEVFTKMNGLVKTMANNLPRSSQPVSSQTLTMAVSQFDIRSGLSADQLEVVMELFIAQFVSGGAKVVDRNSFDKIRAEMNFQDSDWADSNKVAQLGRALNANSIIRGTVTSLGGQISVTSTILDINTAQILSSATMRMGGVAEIFVKLPDFVKDLELNMPGVKLVRIEGGTFQMGSNNGRDTEKPVHTVTVSAFYLGKYEVTQKEWEAVMRINPSSFKGDILPVENVTWFDVVEYCNRLSQKEGLTPAYTISGRTPASGYPITAATVTWNRNANGYRLPTEAEWEYAARGGNGSPNNYTYAGSNTVDEVAWYSGNSGSRTHDVGTKKPNGLGLYDMSGNVYEWCWDRYGNYSSGAQNNPIGASSGSNRV